MGNQSRGKYQVGVNDVYTFMALCGIILWINAAGITGVVAIEIEVDVSYESCQQHESYQRRSGDENPDPVSVHEDEDIPTIFPGHCGDPVERAKFFKNAAENSETNEDLITAVTVCTRAELQEVSVAYSKAYNKTLSEAVPVRFATTGTNEYFFHYETRARVDPLPHHLARCFHDAIDYTYDDKIQIIVGFVNDSLPAAVRQAYTEIYKSDISRAVWFKNEWEFRKSNYINIYSLIRNMYNGMRDPDTTVNDETACQDAKKIMEVRESGRWRENYNEFLTILSTRNFHQLRKISECFENLSGVALKKAIDDDFPFYERKIYNAVLEYAESKINYFAKRLNIAVKGPGTDDLILACIIPWRADIDLGSIKVAYQKLHGTSLYDDVEDDTSSDYGALLLALIGK